MVAAIKRRQEASFDSKQAVSEVSTRNKQVMAARMRWQDARDGCKEMIAASKQWKEARGGSK